MNEEVRDDEATPEEQIQRLRAEVEEWKDLAHRRSAEIANIQRRTQQERQDLMVYASEHMITRMLPVLDDLHAAVDAASKSSESSALRTGVEMIYAKALKIFEAGPGEPFNVEFHEALMHTPSDQPEGHVVQNVQRGYLLHEKVIRHAKVITSAGLPHHTQTAEGEPS
ncbi:MAG: nucleotide exchange factor GrpE [Candidatus Kapabacteria bacterium]|nr:nucleotide exchange factor GrpE [Candidatus Kapabacteria bacterium]